ncbi:MAG: DNA-processing protein DprA [Oscillospiraceae bacterium]|nr:DNA-processing protein DprA [Oscillospiraceae bacterium]
MIAHWIWLATRPGITDRMKAELVRHFGDPETIYFADAGAFDTIEGLAPEGREALYDRNLTGAEEILDACDRAGLRILTYQDAAYPARLRNIADPPLVFYYKGRLPDFDSQPFIGVVGTRKASPYGLTAAKRMGYQIARCGGIVVSGMAYGIDGMAMRGALTAGETVVGILGCGADLVYPLSNRALFADMERYGCIMSEFPPGTPPHKWNFPKRNRVISGISCGVLVVEAPEKSGALITAHQAADQGRDVFVVPGNIDVPTFVGSNRLLRDGAIAVSSGWDILSEYEALFPGRIRRFDRVARLESYPDEVEAQTEKSLPKVAQKVRLPREKAPAKQKDNKKVIDKRTSSPYIDLNDILSGLSETEQTIVRAIAQRERLVDDVIAETGLSTGKVLATLTLLEVKGIVQRLPGRQIALKKGKQS